jgi:pimeloyl-ACP methyl ester carboxylesterase
MAFEEVLPAVHAAQDAAEPDEFGAMSRYVDLNGPVHYLDFGGPADAPLLVCVHGLGGSHVNWVAIGPRLATTCRVLALDLAGHGRTPLAGRSPSVHANRRLLHRFLTEVVSGPVILVGNSMGGMISLTESAEAPENVSGLVLVDPALPLARRTKLDRVIASRFLGGMVPGLGERVMARRRGAQTPEEVAIETLAVCCVDYHRVPLPVYEATVRVVEERHGHPEVTSAYLGAARSLMGVMALKRAYHKRMRSLRQPVLLLHGARDRLVPLAAAKEAARANPHWRFEVAEDIGHVPQLEAPDWTTERILDWLSAEGASAAAATKKTRPRIPAHPGSVGQQQG